MSVVAIGELDLINLVLINIVIHQWIRISWSTPIPHASVAILMYLCTLEFHRQVQSMGESHWALKLKLNT